MFGIEIILWNLIEKKNLYFLLEKKKVIKSMYLVLISC